MLIHDLPYFENASETPLISGSAGIIVMAEAFASGSSTNTFAITSTKARSLPNSGSLAIGRGFSFAKGDESITGVEVTGYGDIVVGSTNSTPNLGSKPVDVSTGVIFAIILPS